MFVLCSYKILINHDKYKDAICPVQVKFAKTNLKYIKITIRHRFVLNQPNYKENHE